MAEYAENVQLSVGFVSVEAEIRSLITSKQNSVASLVQKVIDKTSWEEITEVTESPMLEKTSLNE